MSPSVARARSYVNSGLSSKPPLGNVIARSDEGQTVHFRSRNELDEFIEKYRQISFWHFDNEPDADYELPYPF